MPRVEGRLLVSPIVTDVHIRDRIILRVDDAANPEFWCTLSFTPEEWIQTTERYFKWVAETYGVARLVEAGAHDASG